MNVSIYRTANSQSSTPTRLLCTHAQRDICSPIQYISFLWNEWRESCYVSECMVKLSSVHPRPKEARDITWTSSIGVVTVVRGTWYKNFNIMKLHCDTNIEKISAISTLAEHLIFSKGMLSIKEKFILMKVITASSKRCNKVCEQFEQCMSKCRAGV